MDDQDKNELNEPALPYKRKMQVRVYGSFEEMNEADAAGMAAIEPLDHLRNAVNLIKRVFASEMSKPMNKTIRFK